jgi:thioredoxin 1
MKPALRILAVAMILAAAAVVIYQRQFKTAQAQGGPATMSARALPSLIDARPLPRLLDLGGDYCAPGKAMTPILEELAAQYKDRLVVVRLDVEKNKAGAEALKIKVTPTQIFYSPEGKELFRHEGFYAKDEILVKWEQLGYDLAAPAATASSPASGPTKAKSAPAPAKPAAKPGAS